MPRAALPGLGWGGGRGVGGVAAVWVSVVSCAAVAGVPWPCVSLLGAEGSRAEGGWWAGVQNCAALLGQSLPHSAPSASLTQLVSARANISHVSRALRR